MDKVMALIHFQYNARQWTEHITVYSRFSYEDISSPSLKTLGTVEELYIAVQDEVGMAVVANSINAIIVGPFGPEATLNAWINAKNIECTEEHFNMLLKATAVKEKDIITEIEVPYLDPLPQGEPEPPRKKEQIRVCLI